MIIFTLVTYADFIILFIIKVIIVFMSILIGITHIG